MRKVLLRRIRQHAAAHAAAAPTTAISTARGTRQLPCTASADRAADKTADEQRCLRVQFVTAAPQRDEGTRLRSGGDPSEAKLDAQMRVLLRVRKLLCAGLQVPVPLAHASPGSGTHS